MMEKIFINFAGEIGYGHAYYELIDNLMKTSKGDVVDILINSEGGDVSIALSICDLINHKKEKGVEINTIGFGKVQSAAVLPFLCGTKRKAALNTDFLIHGISIEFDKEILTAGKFMSVADNVKKQTDYFIKMLKDVGNQKLSKQLTSKTIDLYSGNDYYLSTEEMKNFGLVTSIGL